MTASGPKVIDLDGRQKDAASRQQKELEAALIGAAIRADDDQSAIVSEALATAGVSDFMGHHARRCWEAVGYLHRGGETVYLGSVVTRVSDRHAGEDVSEYVAQCDDGCATAANIVHESKAVRRAAIRRERRRLCEEPERDDLAERLADLKEQEAALDGEGSQREPEYAARFSDEATSFAYIADTEPESQEFLIPDFMPANESGMLVALGGTGKGHFNVNLCLSMVLGEPFGPFRAGPPRGVVLLSVEDNREEMHRRFTAAFESKYRDECDVLTKDWRRELREILIRRVRVIDLRGETAPCLGQDLRDQVSRVVERVENPGLVVLDPLTRLLPPGLLLNDQAGAGQIANELDAIRKATGCFPLLSHHVNKAALRDDSELKAGAATGSQLLSDLARWQINLASLTRKKSGEYGLDLCGSYVEAAVVKTNYTPPLTEPLVFRRDVGGALFHVRARSKSAGDDEAALTALLKLGAWCTGDEWETAAKELEDLAVNRTREARKRLKANGSVESVTLRAGKKYRVLFAPADRLRPTGWPDPPPSLDVYDGGQS